MIDERFRSFLLLPLLCSSIRQSLYEMLKRLSNSFSQSSDQLLLVPPPPFPTSRSAPSSPHLYSGSPSSFPFPVTTATKDDVIDRATLHKSLESLSNLVAALDQLHHASRAHNKAHKLFSKCLRDLATTTKTPAADALSASATMFDTLAQVDMKLAKVVATEYEQLNDVVHKYFKLTARDEKQYDDHMQTIDRKLSRANVEYQKLHQSSPLLFSKHAKYVDTVQQLQTESSRLTREYAVAITTAREQIATRVARSSVELARHEWRHRVDSVKKSSTPNVLGHLSDKGLWVEHGMADVVKAAAAFNDDDKIDVEPSSSSSSRVESAIRGREADIGHNSERESQRSSALAVQDERRAGQDAPAKRASFTTRHVDQSLSSSSSSSRPSPEETVAATTSTTSRSTIPSRSSTSSPLTNSVVESTTTTLSTAEAGGGGGRTLPRGWYLDPSFASHHVESHRSPASSRPTLESSPRRIGPDAFPAIETIATGREEQQQHEAGTIARGAETGTGGTARVVVDEGEPRDGSVRATGNLESQQREEGEEGSFVRRMSQRFNGSPAVSFSLSFSVSSLIDSSPKRLMTNGMFALSFCFCPRERSRPSTRPVQIPRAEQLYRQSHCHRDVRLNPSSFPLQRRRQREKEEEEESASQMAKRTRTTTTRVKPVVVVGFLLNKRTTTRPSRPPPDQTREFRSSRNVTLLLLPSSAPSTNVTTERCCLLLPNVLMNDLLARSVVRRSSRRCRCRRRLDCPRTLLHFARRRGSSSNSILLLLLLLLVEIPDDEIETTTK